MKKFLSLLLALVMCVAVFAACTPDNGELTATEQAVKNATAYLKNMYKSYLTNNETASDFELVSVVKVGGIDYTVTWTVDNEAIKVVAGEGKVTIEVADEPKEAVEYNLTAVVSAADGTKGEALTFKLKVPASNLMTIPEALAAADDTFITVKGTVTLINTAWDEGYKNISVTISDDEGNELYLYRLATKVELGDVITVKGTMATYNNARQVAAGATAEITGHVEVKNEYPEYSIPDALKLDDNALLTVKGTVVDIGTAWSEQYSNISVTIADDAGNKLYIFRLATKVELGDIITVKGIMATYNGSRQIAAGATAEITGHTEITQDYVEVSIADALKADDGKLVIIKGTVAEIKEAWTDQYGNNSFFIVDEAGNRIYIFRTKTKVELGDIVTVKGKVSSYNGEKQIAQDAETTITGKGEVPEGGNNQGGGAVTAPDGSIKYTFADYEQGTQYAKNEAHKLDDTLTVTTNEAHFREEIRLYHSAANQYNPDGRHSTAVFSSAKAIKTLVINAGNNEDVLKVSASVDGTTWTVVKEITVASAYADYLVELTETNYKFIKVESTEKQIRIKSVSVLYVG